MNASERAKASHLTEFLKIIRRRKWTVIITALAIALPVGTLVAVMAPTYSAESEILLDASKQKVAEMKDVLVEGPLDEGTVLSEIQVLSSRNLAKRVIQHLQLLDDPNFIADLQAREGIARYADYLNPWAMTDQARPLEAESHDTLLDKATTIFLDKLRVRRVGESRVISIVFFSHSPETAAKVANTVAEFYVNLTVEAKIDAAERATEWLQQQIRTLQPKVEKAERQVVDYRQSSDLVLGDRAPLLAQEVSQANSQLLAIVQSRVEAEARLREMKTLLAANSIDSAIDVMASPLILQLRQQEIALIRKKAELASVYGDRHSVMVQVNAELNDLEGKIAFEIKKIVESYKNKVAIAQAQEAAMAKRLEELKMRIGGANHAEVKLNALDREAQANQMVLQNFMARMQETTAQTDISIQQPEAEVISKAAVPEKPYLPKIFVLFGLTAVATMSGVGVALGAEQLDRSLRSTEELDLGAKVRTLALVPRIRKGFGRTRPETYVLNHPSSMLGESIRSIYTAIRLSKSLDGRTSVLFTSAHAGEGKTTVALCLGRLRALAGSHCVLVEADLRKPRVCSRLGIRPKLGLTELLKGEANIFDVLVKDPASDLYVIPAGATCFDPAEALASDRMGQLLEHLSQAFDLVIFDVPPVLAVSDGLVLSNRVDAVVLIAQWGRTNCDTVKLTLEKLREAGARLAGVVMSMVDPRKHALTNCKDSDYFNHRTTKYYKN